KLTALYNSAKTLGRIGSSSPFSAFTVSSSSSTVVDATATSSAAIGSHTLDSVTRLAKADILLSTQLTASDTSMIAGLGAGTKTFSINGVEVSVTLTDGQTNDQVIGAIANAVNNTAGVGVSASVLHVDATHTELALTSKNTGAASHIASVTDGNSTLAALLGYGAVSFTDTPGTTPRTIASPSQAGFIEGYSENLDASFSLNGVAMTRGSNTISDAVNGLTLKLTGTSTTPVSLTIAPDNAGIEATVNSFISNYNATITYLATQTTTDATAGTRGPFADDMDVRYLSSDLRALMLHSVSTVATGAPAVLSAVGITTNADGTLSLSDTTKFETALAANPSQVSDLFNSTNGVANLLQAKLKGFVSYGGSIDSETKSSNKQIKSFTDRITLQNARIDKQVAAYKQQFVDIQQLLNQAAQQQLMINSFASYGA
ncbi:MAG TPA: flagellar filament capping protein FliD, partial [Bacteroidota bacterium]|nr:flagellar filament capping protein FliD [Bacteroidota bacterium]